MVGFAEGVKRCAYCGQEKPWSEFYVDRRGVRSARCRRCHGLARRVCVICGNPFTGKSGAKVCSADCRRSLRPRTFLRCANCGQTFGPVDRLSRKYCSVRCKVEAQTTGRRTFRRTVAKARAAQSLVRYHLSTGRLVRPAACEECGATDVAIEAAHFNYDEPLRVRWLCRPCHRRWDKQQPKNGTVVVQDSTLARKRASIGEVRSAGATVQAETCLETVTAQVEKPESTPAVAAGGRT